MCTKLRVTFLYEMNKYQKCYSNSEIFLACFKKKKKKVFSSRAVPACTLHATLLPDIASMLLCS